MMIIQQFAFVVALVGFTRVAARTQTIEFKLGEYKIKIPTNQPIEVPRISAVDLVGPDLTRLLNVAAEAAGESPVRQAHPISDYQSLSVGPLLPETTTPDPPILLQPTISQSNLQLYSITSKPSTPDTPTHYHRGPLFKNRAKFRAKETIRATPPPNRLIPSHGAPHLRRQWPPSLPPHWYRRKPMPQQYGSVLEKVVSPPSVVPRSSPSIKHQRWSTTTPVADVWANRLKWPPAIISQHLNLSSNHTKTSAAVKAIESQLEPASFHTHETDSSDSFTLPSSASKLKSNPTIEIAQTVMLPLQKTKPASLLMSRLTASKSPITAFTAEKLPLESLTNMSSPLEPTTAVYDNEPINTRLDPMIVTSHSESPLITTNLKKITAPVQVQPTTTVPPQTSEYNPSDMTRSTEAVNLKEPVTYITVVVTQSESVKTTTPDEEITTFSNPMTVVSPTELITTVPSTEKLSELTTTENPMLNASHSISQTIMTSSPVALYPHHKTTFSRPIAISQLESTTKGLYESTLIIPSPSDETISASLSSQLEFDTTSTISTTGSSHTIPAVTVPASLEPEQTTITTSPAVKVYRPESTTVAVTQLERTTAEVIKKSTSIMNTKESDVTIKSYAELETQLGTTTEVPWTTNSIKIVENTWLEPTKSSIKILTDIIATSINTISTETNITEEPITTLSVVDLPSPSSFDKVKDRGSGNSSAPGLTTSRPAKRCTKKRTSNKSRGRKCRKKRRRHRSTTATANPHTMTAY